MNGDRLIERLTALAEIGRDTAGGVSRLAFSAEDVAGRMLVATWMEQAGLTVELDAATNLIGRRSGRRPDAPVIALGSHLDTVRQGGHLDGALGVVAGVEVAAACKELDHSLAVVAFANEEGTTAPPGFTGSLAIVGSPPDPSDVVDGTGRTLGEAIAGAGGRPEELGSCAWPAGSVAAFLELHIEQGPVLEAAGAALGIVDAITGRIVLDLEISGQASHAGTMPMEMRHDALVAGAEIILAVKQLATSGLVRVATAGVVRCIPNLHNVVPGRVDLGIDIRDSDDAKIREVVEVVKDKVASIAEANGVAIVVREGLFVSATPIDPALRGDVEEAATPLGSAMRLPSGASHDAQIMSRIGPVAMLFVPSGRGLSHSPAEWTSPEELILGATCLADIVARVDRRH
jgi:N-carbamoyl-L-amino-acid hydrolase